MDAAQKHLSPGALTHALIDAQSVLRRNVPTSYSIPIICKGLVELLGCDRSSILLLGDDDRYRWVHNWGNPPVIAAKFAELSISRSNDIPQQLERAGAGAFLVFNDALQHPEVCVQAKMAGISSLAVAMLVSEEGGPIGIMTAGYCDHISSFGDLELVVLLGAAGLVQTAIQQENAKQEKVRLTLDAADAQDGERRRLALELHDHALQDVYGICLRLETMQQQFGEGRVSEELETVIVESRKAAAGLRNLTNDMHPEAKASAGLHAVLHQLLIEMAEEEHWRVTFEDKTTIKPSPEASAALNRIAEQTLGNIREHAGATHVTMSLTTAGKGTQLQIVDNGCGFDDDTTHPGHLGITSMNEQAAHNNGLFRVDSKPGNGTVIETWLPHQL